MVVEPVVAPDGPVRALVVTAEDEPEPEPPAPPTTVKMVVLPVVLPAGPVRADVVIAEEDPEAVVLAGPVAVPVSATTAEADPALAEPRADEQYPRP